MADERGAVTDPIAAQPVQGLCAGLRGLGIYAQHVLGLARPGRSVPTYLAPKEFTADLSKWEEEDLKLLIEEGRRQFDAQLDSLERIRGRAQWLFSTALALAAVDAALAAKLFPHPSGWGLAAWLGSLAFTSWSGLGAAAIITVNAKLVGIAAAPLSRYTPPIQTQLATDYAEILDAGEQTINTRFTLYRQAVVWLILGGYATLAAFLVGRYGV
jgi:hypothetical protein